MKLKVTPIVLAVAGSAAILFGGWFIYNSLAVEKPLNQALNDSPGVVSSEAQISGTKVVYRVALNSEANLREVVHDIDAKSAEVAAGRTVEINVESDSSQDLEDWWSQALFGVAQAMETSQYADIPASLQEKAAQLADLAVKTEMDEKNVYVTLTQGEHSKYVILPRNATGIGVWPNE